ncbi:MAG: GTP 3',8-cyclase MoaA [Planctomycetota bacterium]|nr:GTP 3',8-cyclase MoaA [Planctomycetota bacterium]
MSTSLPIFNATSNDATPPPAAPDESRASNHLLDSHGRVIRDLRLSITDRCNYRCIYCMDPDFRYMPKRELLSFDEYITLARICVGLGVEKLRITGGEPTMYSRLNELIDELGQLPIRDLAMTTNGSLLETKPLARWRKAGLHRITLSLDSLDPDKVKAITRTKTSADTVVRAIELAREAGFDPIKVNSVVMKDVNDNELADFADFARTHDIDMRFIEFMPLDSSHAWERSKVITADQIIEAISARHELVPIKGNDPHSTSLNFTFADGAPGRIGIIAPVSRPFCGACSRLRITADGKIRPCLFSHQEWDIRPVLRRGGSDEDIIAFLQDATWTKKKGHGISEAGFTQPSRTMSAIGG